MKNSIWSGASVWLVAAALLLPGCGASDGGSNHESAGNGSKTDGSGEGTNTGNGACAAPWCSFPRVLTGDDGKTYGGTLTIYGSQGGVFQFEGGEVLDTATGCTARTNLELPVPIVPTTTDANGTIHFQRQSLTSAIEAADLTLTPEHDVSGTITARLRVEEGGYVRLDDPTPTSADNTWTTVFTVTGKAQVYCWENQSAVTLQRADGTTVTLACGPEPVPTSGPSCHDTISP